ncbi:MAG: response regulator [Planctomycetota bacterium]|nr:MAG: response regulator [Planctomycetota bacterium]
MDSESREALERRIAELEAEVERLRRASLAATPSGPTVQVPPQFVEPFAEAQRTVAEYFRGASIAPPRATIQIGGDRYVLVRAASLSRGFLSAVRSLYADRGAREALRIGRNILFDLAHVIGLQDAIRFHDAMGLGQPLEKLAAGPVHFAHTGWAFVDILPESDPEPGDGFCLIYRHPYSFEAESWLSAGEETDSPVCIMNAGYSSGWCEASVGQPLTAVEVTCRARGDDHCLFVMASPERVRARVEAFLRREAGEVVEAPDYQVPSFFERKRSEERIREAYERAEAANRAKTQFLANMSHELRTPLNGILGLTRLLQSTDLDAEQRQLVETIGHSGAALLAILNDVLDLSRIEAGKLSTVLGPCDVRQIVREVHEVLHLGAAEKHLALRLAVEAEVPPVLVTDAVRLRQVLLNLVGNAIKFTDRGEVAVEVSWEPYGDGCGALHVEVRDTGIGIAPEDQERLFEEFSQLDGSATRRHGGTGLGLSICRNLVRLLDGSIGVRSQPGKGSTFWFRLPVEVASAPLAVRPPEEATDKWFGTLRGRVLVVEDNRVNQLVARKLLERLGCSVDVAPNGREALERTESEDYDLVLMDCQMPELDGRDATRLLRAREREAGRERVPVVAMTASVMPGDTERCLDAGMDAVLPKPLDFRRLRDVLAGLLP